MNFRHEWDSLVPTVLQVLIYSNFQVLGLFHVDLLDFPFEFLWRLFFVSVTFSLFSRISSTSRK